MKDLIKIILPANKYIYIETDIRRYLLYYVELSKEGLKQKRRFLELKQFNLQIHEILLYPCYETIDAIEDNVLKALLMPI